MTDLRRLTVPAVAVTAALLMSACASKVPAAAPGAPNQNVALPVGAVSSPTGTPAAPAAPRALPTLPQRTWPSNIPPGQEVLDVAAHNVETAVKSQFADWFSGIAVKQPTGPDDKTPYSVVVYRIPHPALDAAAQAAAPDTHLIFVDAKYSLAQCQVVNDTVTKDMTYWSGRGLHLISWGCYPTGMLQIGVEEPDKWRAALAARYGPEVDVVQEGPISGGPLVQKVSPTK